MPLRWWHYNPHVDRDIFILSILPMPKHRPGLWKVLTDTNLQVWTDNLIFNILIKQFILHHFIYFVSLSKVIFTKSLCVRPNFATFWNQFVKPISISKYLFRITCHPISEHPFSILKWLVWLATATARQSWTIFESI